MWEQDYGSVKQFTFISATIKFTVEKQIYLEFWSIPTVDRPVWDVYTKT